MRMYNTILFLALSALSVLMVYSEGTGQKVWNLNTDSPATLTILKDGTLLSTENAGYITAYDTSKTSKDGQPKTKWQYKIPKGPTGCRNSISTKSLVVDDSTIYFGTNAWCGNPGTFFKIDTNGNLIGKDKQPDGALTFVGMALTSDTRYVVATANTGDGSGDAAIFKYEHSTSNSNSTNGLSPPLFDYRIRGRDVSEEPLSFVGEPVLDESGNVYVASMNAEIYAISSKGELMWQFSAGGYGTDSFIPYIKIFKDTLIVVPTRTSCASGPGKCNLSWLSTKTGKLIQQIPFIDGHANEPTLVDGAAYITFGQYGGVPTAGAAASFDAATGNINWNITIPGVNEDAPVVDGHSIYVASVVGSETTFSSLDRKSGDVTWTQTVQNSYLSKCGISDQSDVYCTAGPNLYALKKSNQIDWTVPVLCTHMQSFFDQKAVIVCDGGYHLCQAYIG